MNLDYLDILLEKLTDWGTKVVSMLPNIGLALLVLLVFVFLGKLTRRLIRKILTRAYNNEELTSILARIGYIAVVLGGAMASLSILHLDKTVTSLLAGAGIIGLALSFAFQDLAANFVSGFFMALKKPFEIGDVIEVEGYTGTVLAISLRSTEIMTFDGNEVVIPNRKLFENPLTNYYRTKTRRVDLNIGVSYAEDLDQVQQITKNAIEQIPSLVEDKEVLVIFQEFGDSSINLQVQYWVPYDNYSQYLVGISEGIKAVKKAYDKHNILIPFPIRTMDFGIKGGEKLDSMLNSSTNNSPKLDEF
ncbi:mechanosensitive ion channel family protein [Crocinitomix algicola]|uniref:mechanosensitive ion channel family protein n=1 Tax=Crocinitomix algicola TaxID=1740263 RepID=UPI00087333A7|nr:mechanosensitive ion channel family protein [Crocinitomix algicola]